MTTPRHSVSVAAVVLDDTGRALVIPELGVVALVFRTDVVDGTAAPTEESYAVEVPPGGVWCTRSC